MSSYYCASVYRSGYKRHKCIYAEMWISQLLFKIKSWLFFVQNHKINQHLALSFLNSLFSLFLQKISKSFTTYDVIILYLSNFPSKYAATHRISMSFIIAILIKRNIFLYFSSILTIIYPSICLSIFLINPWP